MNKLQQLKKRAFLNPQVNCEYKALAEEFELINQLLTMRNAAGLTQSELAELMGTKKSNISRMENGRSNPSWHTLKKYAKACGYEISMDFHVA